MDISYSNILNKALEQKTNFEKDNVECKIQVIISKEVIDLSITPVDTEIDEIIIDFFENYKEKDILAFQKIAKDISVELGLIYEVIDMRSYNR